MTTARATINHEPGVGPTANDYTPYDRDRYVAVPNRTGFGIIDTLDGSLCGRASRLGQGLRYGFDWHTPDLWRMTGDDLQYLIREYEHGLSDDPLGDYHGRNE